MDADRRDPNKPGRREEDERWLKVQEQIMNLVTAERTDQQELAAMKVTVEKLIDHVDDLDDHLRGVAGHQSMDTRVEVLERETTSNGVLLRQIKKHLEELRTDVAAIKIVRALHKESDATKQERFREWLKFWGPIILATIALIVPLATLAVNNWGTIKYIFKQEDTVSRHVQKNRPRKKIYRYKVVPAPKVIEPVVPQPEENHGNL